MIHLLAIMLLVQNVTMPVGVNSTVGLFNWANNTVGGMMGIGLSIALFLIILVSVFAATHSPEAGLLFGGLSCLLVSLAFEGMGIAPGYLVLVYFGVTALGFLLIALRGSTHVY